MKKHGKIRVMRPMSVPIAMMLCRIAKVRVTVNKMVQWKEQNAKISPGLLIETLVVCILCQRKPLWKVEQFWEGQDMQQLFSEDISAHQLNDDAYGHALDKLAEVNMNLLISMLSMTMLKAHQLGISFVHLDTTSKSVQGAYEGETPEDFQVTFGFSKDHRPDLKQFKYGLGVQENGLPIMGQVLSGNESDMAWNPQAAIAMTKFFEEKQFRDIIFVSDCAIVSTESLQELARHHIHFISRLPETFCLAERLKEQAFAAQQWHGYTPTQLAQPQKPDLYQISEIEEELDGRRYRFLVIQSAALEKSKEKTLRKQITKKKEELEAISKKLGKQEFACEPDAQKQLREWMKMVQKKHFAVQGTVVAEETKCYQRKGRPKEGEEPTLVTVYRIQGTVGDFDPQAWEEAKRKASTFVLITNVMDAKKYDTNRLLSEYKQQISVENRFRFLKNPVHFGPVYLKNQQRIQALGYVFIIVLLLACYLEYRVRKTLKKRGETILLPGNKRTATPSITTILEILETLQVILIDSERMFPDNVDSQALKMIEWAGFDTSIYLQPLPAIS